MGQNALLGGRMIDGKLTRFLIMGEVAFSGIQELALVKIFSQ
jgi:hypothetical protein